MPEPPEIKHIKIIHRRHESGIHEPPTERLVKVQDAHRPYNIPLSEKIVAKDAKVQADRDTPEDSKKPATTHDMAPIVRPIWNHTSLSAKLHWKDHRCNWESGVMDWDWDHASTKVSQFLVFERDC